MPENDASRLGRAARNNDTQVGTAYRERCSGCGQYRVLFWRPHPWHELRACVDCLALPLADAEETP